MFLYCSLTYYYAFKLEPKVGKEDDICRLISSQSVVVVCCFVELPLSSSSKTMHQQIKNPKPCRQVIHVNMVPVSLWHYL